MRANGILPICRTQHATAALSFAIILCRSRDAPTRAILFLLLLLGLGAAHFAQLGEHARLFLALGLLGLLLDGPGRHDLHLGLRTQAGYGLRGRQQRAGFLQRRLALLLALALHAPRRLLRSEEHTSELQSHSD